MRAKKCFLTGVLALVLGVFAGSAFAIQEIPLKGEMWKGVIGDVVISDVGNIEGEKQFDLYVTGLKPNSIYTVWLTKDDPALGRQSAGLKEEHFFETDGSGNGHYLAYLSEFDVNRFDKIEVAEHPDRDPANLENSIIALRADLGPGRK